MKRGATVNNDLGICINHPTRVLPASRMIYLPKRPSSSLTEKTSSSLRGTKQSAYRASRHVISDCFVPRNDGNIHFPVSSFSLSQQQKNKTPKKTTGFTLMELLVSVTLLSIVMASVYSLTNTALGAWRTVENGSDLQFEARSFITLFSHEYNNIVGRAAHLFEGDSSSIVMFVVAQPLEFDQGEGPRLMRVEYTYNRSKHSIIREEALVEAALPLPETEGQSIDPGRVKLDRPYKTTVANNVEQFNLQYIWAPTPVEGLPEDPPIPEPLIYRDAHKDKQSLPQGIEITLEFTDPRNKERTFPMVITLPMRAPTVRYPRHHLEAMFDEAA